MKQILFSENKFLDNLQYKNGSFHVHFYYVPNMYQVKDQLV